MSTTLELINAIATGDAVATESAFNAAMAEKIAGKIDSMRLDVAKNMFAAPEAAPAEPASTETPAE